jgi:hypothetical protein
MSAALQRLHDALAPLIAAAIAEVEADRQAAAEAIQAAHCAAPSALYAQGRADQRRDILALLEAQQEALGGAGLNSLSLATLRHSIEAME